MGDQGEVGTGGEHVRSRCTRVIPLRLDGTLGAMCGVRGFTVVEPDDRRGCRHGWGSSCSTIATIRVPLSDGRSGLSAGSVKWPRQTTYR